jgi:hypothetical protein
MKLTMPALALLPILAGTAAAIAQPSEGLAPFFGFSEPRIVKVGEDAGPVTYGDFNGDGRPDIAVVNNRRSRIELFYLRAAPRTADEVQRSFRANEIPPNPWYDRESISVSHRISAIRAHDVNGDGKLDIVYAGSQPAEIVVLRQESPTRFTTMARQRVSQLGARHEGFAIADVMGDEGLEILAIAGGRIHIYPLTARGRFGEPKMLGSGASSDQIRSLAIEDFDGDGRLDVLGLVPDDSAPVRLWLQAQDPDAKGKAGLLASELRFEMPQLREASPIRFPGRKGASIGVIERAANRVAFFDLSTAQIAGGGSETISEREVQAEVTSFEDTGAKNRSVIAADLSGNGMPDLVTTDQKGNAIVIYRQEQGLGLASSTSYAAFKTPRQVEVGRWFDLPRQQLFVLSEEEKTVGFSTIDPDDGRVNFPTPIAFKTAGATPLVMRYLQLGDTPALAVILKDRRDYVLELHTREGNGASEGSPEWNAHIATVALKDVKRDPAAILPFDYDRDGTLDLLVLTPGEPMMMVQTQLKEDKFTPGTVLTKDTMPQFGLVQAAGPENTALLDVDGDGQAELLIADANYVRFAAYDGEKGWRVVDQVNVPDSSTQLVGLAMFNGGDEANQRIIASDKANGRLLSFARNEAGRWVLRERTRMLGFAAGPIRAGRFAGDATPSVLALSDDAFALVRLGGQRAALEQFAAYTAETDNRLQHNLTAGDLNGDGFTDAVVLDGREQMCQILTFSQSRKLFPATEFKVFESRLFSRGESRELQPSRAFIADLTGDGHNDLMLLVHDRVIIYPQMAASTDGIPESVGDPAAGLEATPARPEDRPKVEKSLEPTGPG